MRGLHRGGVQAVGTNEYKAFPLSAPAFGLRPQTLQKTLAELNPLASVHGANAKMRGSNRRFHQRDVLIFIVVRRANGGTPSDLLGIQEIEHGEMLRSQNAVHGVETQTALVVEEV